jgi:predicted ester cyclase
MLSADPALDARKAVVLRTFHAMTRGEVEDFAAAVHPDFFNHEQRDEPPATRGPRLEQIRGVAAWLHAAFADLRWELHEIVAEGDLVAVHATMAGRHAGDFVAYDLDGRVDTAFAATGRSFAVTQTHWQRMRDGLVAEHWAQRDDFGCAEQLGWSAPTPSYLVRCALAKRRAKRAADPPRRAEERPFGPWRGERGEAKAVALRALELMRGASPDAFRSVYLPDASTRPLVIGQRLAGGRGPEVFHAATRWLTDAFADLERVVHHVVAEDGLVAMHLTLSGRQVAPLAFHDERGALSAVFPATGKRFAAQETHWLRLAGDGRVAEHWVNRDDLGMAMQLGWVPPTPPYLIRMALAKRRFQRSTRP